MSGADGRSGRMVLIASHCAGMLDLVALPVWVGVLMTGWRLDPQTAGGLVTLYLLGAVSASAVFAPRFNRIDARLGAAAGFGCAALAFLVAATTRSTTELALLHVAGGFAAGTGLSFTHGTIGRSANPHRLFSVVSMALGIFSAFFLGSVPPMVSAWGEPALFRVFAAVLGFACLAAALAFPAPAREPATGRTLRAAAAPMPRSVWFCVAGVSCLALVQSMLFSFIQRMGVDRGFGVDQIAAVLVSIGALAVFAPALAALTEKRLNARAVVIGGAIAQASLALVISRSSGLAPYAACGVLLLTVMLFTHSFAFGELARLDSTGRAVAATPAMLMLGAAVGPLLGGTLIKSTGYGALGFAALGIDLVALGMFLLLLGSARAHAATKRSTGADPLRPAAAVERFGTVP